MATVTRQVPASPADVWDVLADGWRYSNWVVGTSHMRAVDADWPRTGTRLDHASGLWPFVVRDDTVVVASEPPQSLELIAHGGPLGDARIRITIAETTTGCAVVMAETPVSGPGRWLHNPAFDALIRARNTEALGRLAALAEQRRPERPGAVGTTS